jgi:hypothetical protein
LFEGRTANRHVDGKAFIAPYMQSEENGKTLKRFMCTTWFGAGKSLGVVRFTKPLHLPFLLNQIPFLVGWRVLHPDSNWIFYLMKHVLLEIYLVLPGFAYTQVS